MVVDVAAGTMSALIAKNDDTWQDMGTLFSTPEDGQVFKIAGNRITLTSNDNTREFISFHVLYDDKGGAVNVHFEYGEKIDLVGSWCLPLPNHPPFVGETCTRGAVKLGTKIGTRTAYRVSVTTDTTTQDSGEMRDPNSRLCFWATDVFTNVTNPATNRNVTGARRCVYLRTIPPTDFPYIYPKIGSDPPKSADNIVAFVGNGEVPTADQGYELRLEVRAKSVVANLKVDIESSTYGGRVFAELPGQRWAGRLLVSLRAIRTARATSGLAHSYTAQRRCSETKIFRSISRRSHGFQRTTSSVIRPMLAWRAQERWAPAKTAPTWPTLC